MTGDTAAIPLRLGALSVEGFEVQRSGVRWLREDGHECRAGEVIAWCNIGLARKPGFPAQSPPFREEPYDFQVALATRAGGRLEKADAASRGGFLDLQHYYRLWATDAPIGHLRRPPDAPPCDPAEAGELRMLMLAGRRVTEHAEVRSGLLTGWHDRSRAWWSGIGDDGRYGTVLSLGICEQLGIIRGERGGFLELFEAAPGPAHVAFVPDDVLVPTAAVLLSQLRRTEAERRAILEDMNASFGALVGASGASGLSAASDWIFAGCLVKALLRSPITERYDILSPTRIAQVGPADALILSMNAEQPYSLRHKRLGYPLSCHNFRIQDAGPVMARWFRENFETIRKAPEQIRRDYLDLIDAIRERSAMHILVLNSMSSVGLEDIYNYSLFDRPLGATLSSIRAKEMNLMLCDLARERDISIVDIDAIAARLGAARHLPDGVHQSGRLQKAVREQILHILRDRGVPGFGGEAGA